MVLAVGAREKAPTKNIGAGPDKEHRGRRDRQTLDTRNHTRRTTEE